jgi:hypothetical protein
MILDVVKLPISKDEFLSCKRSGKVFTDIGNFSKHLKKMYNISIDEYIFKNYFKYLPVCLETNEVCYNKRIGYWNEFIPLDESLTSLSRKVRAKQHVIDRIKLNTPHYYSEYITFEYWVHQHNYKLSEALEKIEYFTNQKYGDLYKRLVDSFYDDSWTIECKNKYINSILEMNVDRLYPKYTENGMVQRGNVSIDECDEYYSKRNTVFRDSEFQRRNSLKRYKKYSKNEIREFSIWCVEYWLKGGYSIEEAIYKITSLQKHNSLDSIMSRYDCDKSTALDIQSQIYSKRMNTMKSKSKDELFKIYKSQDSSSLEYCLKKCNYNLESANKLYTELKEKRVVPMGKASKESLKYFIPLYKLLRKNGIDRSDIYFGVSPSCEYWLVDEYRNFYMYDFTIVSHKLIIEYHGSGHYGFLENHNLDSILNKDKLKKTIAKSNGFSYIEIDYRNDVDYNKNKINEILNEKLQIKNTNW